MIDDGEGIPEKEFDNKDYARCMENRQRNEIYKTRSIGYKGEALDSLARATELTIISKQVESSKAIIVKFNPKTREVSSKTYFKNVLKLNE